MLLPSFLSISVLLSSLFGFVAAESETLHARAPTANGGETGTTFYRATSQVPLFTGFKPAYIHDQGLEILGDNLEDVKQRAKEQYGHHENARWYIYHIDKTYPLVRWGLKWMGDPAEKKSELLNDQAPMPFEIIKGWDEYYGTKHHRSTKNWRYDPDYWLHHMGKTDLIYRPSLLEPSKIKGNGFTKETVALFPDDPVIWGNAKPDDKGQICSMMAAAYPYKKWYLYHFKKTPEFSSTLAKFRNLASLSKEKRAAAFPMPLQLVTGVQLYVGGEFRRWVELDR